VLDRVQQLMERLDGIEDPVVRATTEEVIGALMDLYGEGLERTMTLLDDDARAVLAGDGVVGSLLLIHGLFPVDLETRVRQALDDVAPYMASHGGSVELLGVTDDIAHLRLEGSCKTCAASTSTLELAIKAALDEHAPDLAGIDVVGMPEEDALPGLALPMVQVTPQGTAAPMAPPAPPGWHALNGASAVADGRLAAETVNGARLVIANVDGTLLAYRDLCPACGADLHDGELFGPNLQCPGCQVHYDVTRAGRSLDGTGQLGPVPLLREGGEARVAV
jgi:Fe-S cluster biogenesis protein NfuA/nitrite reductase/ring-hydroxylating ferredoxin subunit